MTKVLKCKCRHEFQDGRYGLGNRVHNEMKTGEYRCTVCEKVRREDRGDEFARLPAGKDK